MIHCDSYFMSHSPRSYGVWGHGTQMCLSWQETPWSSWKNLRLWLPLGLFGFLVAKYEQTERKVILQARLMDSQKHEQGDSFYTRRQEGIHGLTDENWGASGYTSFSYDIVGYTTKHKEWKMERGEPAVVHGYGRGMPSFYRLEFTSDKNIFSNHIHI